MEKEKRLCCQTCQMYIQHYTLSANGKIRKIHSGQCECRARKNKLIPKEHICMFYEEKSEEVFVAENYESALSVLTHVRTQLSYLNKYITSHPSNYMDDASMFLN